MLNRAPAYRATPLELLLTSVPSLPRPILARLTARMIERLDEMDGDPDDELDEDRCGAEDDCSDPSQAPRSILFAGYPGL